MYFNSVHNTPPKMYTKTLFCGLRPLITFDATGGEGCHHLPDCDYIAFLGQKNAPRPSLKLRGIARREINTFLRRECEYLLSEMSYHVAGIILS